MFSHSVQNLLNMLQVLCPTLVEDEDVIQINHHKIIGERPQYIIHHPHESCWGIFQAKEEDQPFKKHFFGLEGNLPYIGLLYWDLVVARLEINLTEVFSPLEFVKEIVNSGNWVPILDCDFISGSVINAKTLGFVFLMH
jgi:hypothetical protein